MRFLVLLCCFVFLTAFTCDNEPIDDDFDLTQDNTITLTGTWKLTSWISSSPVDINNDGVTSTDLLTEFDCYNNETIVFNADGTGISQSTSYADITLELVVGTTDSYEYSVDCIQEIDNFSFNWEQSTNNVTVTDEFNDTYNFTLNQQNQLTIFIPEGFFAANEDFSVTTTQDLTFIYSKQ